MQIVKIKTALALGVTNLARVLFYQLSIKMGLNPVKKLQSEIVTGPFFTAEDIETVNTKTNGQWLGKHTYFGQSTTNSTIPDWHQSCLTKKIATRSLPWFAISDFNNELGDIKGVWEASRFDWVISFAQQAKQGDKDALTKLNNWILDWLNNNAPYDGVNWKCGQEASIRVMHLALAALLLDQTKSSTPALLSFIKAHLKRISSTIMYAVAQDNNHGTSEAAALYIGGSWLAINGDNEGFKWQKQGVKWLENRIDHLIEDDGSFSQYSVNYHRVMLDSISLVEVWRTKHSLDKFSSRFYSKMALATDWLFYFTNVKSGDAPNLGANDGARLIPLTGTDYRDFRPSVQLASAVFKQQLAYLGEGEYNLPLFWLNIALSKNKSPVKKSKDFTNGGYAYLTKANTELFLRYPNFKFRPSQCDALHLDFWLGNKNIFRDGGTFSYNAGQQYIDYYGGVQSHNTVQFDNHDQMPRLSRFLLGDWLKTSFKQPLILTDSSQSFAAGYKDRFGCEHIRSIALTEQSLTISDKVSGFTDKAVLRFRLHPADWHIVDTTLVSKLCKINFSSSVPINRLEITTGLESRYYYQESKIPVLELEVSKAGTITTEVTF
ncbi:heparinase II/III family protein [Kangiella spongicola]|uniref:Heparinase n=1 Tax=Kangiella spongicola TaxID=796379 RepID=A0A318D589_9GAMM|nr:heparinase II/III-family protein [Kangiella spongicola]PXF63028.1 heparinase [Kangiella spongicola]